MKSYSLVRVWASATPTTPKQPDTALAFSLRIVAGLKLRHPHRWNVLFREAAETARRCRTEDDVQQCRDALIAAAIRALPGNDPDELTRTIDDGMVEGGQR